MNLFQKNSVTLLSMISMKIHGVNKYSLKRVCQNLSIKREFRGSSMQKSGKFQGGGHCKVGLKSRAQLQKKNSQHGGTFFQNFTFQITDVLFLINLHLFE